MIRLTKKLSRSDARDVIKDAVKLAPDLTRRRVLHGAMSLGALSLLTGCDIDGHDTIEAALRAVSRFNDQAQALLFDGSRLAQTYPESAITYPFRFNAYYEPDDAPEVDGADYKLSVGGLVENKRPWSLEELYALPQETQITRLICVEGWSAIGKWTGARLSDFLARIGADTRAKYVHFNCAEGYSTSIDMPTALHPQTQMTFRFADDVLPRIYGFPMRVRMPTKLGFKNPKHVVEMFVSNDYTGGYWEDRSYNWFSGL